MPTFEYRRAGIIDFVFVIAIIFFIGLVGYKIHAYFNTCPMIDHEITPETTSIHTSCASDSMGFGMRCQDTVEVQDFNSTLTKPVPGEIYIYKKENGNGTTIHRLVLCLDTDCNFTVFKGDNNRVAELVNRSAIIKKATGITWG